jgi:type II secretory ATPase GspE/PulE/Tfp pilus assembly ATPase PilB-like protein
VVLQLAEAQELDPAEVDAASVQLVASLLEEARAASASDVHLEPRHEDCVVRFRIAGELREHGTLSRTWHARLVRRLKTLAGLDTSEGRFPQDGQARATIGEAAVDLAIATAPSPDGEGAVVRLLDRGQRVIELAALPFSDRQRADLERMLAGGGLVLAAGSMGQGRTTTLYALARRLDLARKKLVTVEDPPEGPIAGAFAMQVEERTGLSMARALRGALHLDPDALLVGELCDRDVAELALQAALSGRLVFSTLHASGAAEAIVRLADMGLEPYLLADALRGVVAQRLVRSLCRECRREAPPEPVTLARLGLDAAPARNFAPAGCEACAYSGWKGRVALYEVLPAAALWDAIRTARSAQELRALARAAGFVTLREGGLAKALAGETTLDEVYAATARG